MLKHFEQSDGAITRCARRNPLPHETNTLSLSLTHSQGRLTKRSEPMSSRGQSKGRCPKRRGRRQCRRPWQPKGWHRSKPLKCGHCRVGVKCSNAFSTFSQPPPSGWVREMGVAWGVPLGIGLGELGHFADQSWSDSALSLNPRGDKPTAYLIVLG